MEAWSLNHQNTLRSFFEGKFVSSLWLLLRYIFFGLCVVVSLGGVVHG